MTIGQDHQIAGIRRQQRLMVAGGAACPSIVKGSLEAVPGVAKVTVSYKDKSATVIYDDAKANVNQLSSATTNAGYPSLPKS